MDSIDRVWLFENHDKAYHIWRESQVRDQLLLHIDAHHDMWWPKKDSEITIANFISPAMRDGLVREVIWVVPDGTWANRSTRSHILGHLKRMRHQHPGRGQKIDIFEYCISLVLNGKRLSVYPLCALPELAEPVLLDIDTDFLVIPKVTHRKADRHGELPWCWPVDLISALRARNIRTSLVTIAYSVEGGYTPLKWKHLGEELLLRLRKPQTETEDLHFHCALRSASTLAAFHDKSAEHEFRRAISLNPENAAAHANLAFYLFERGRIGDARREFQTALDLDSSYRSGYAQLGFVEYGEKHYDRAEHEFRKMLELNPADAYSYLGLAMLAARKKEWACAADFLEACLKHGANIIEAQRLLGDVLTHLHLYSEAAAAYERSLKLGLMGVKRFTMLLTPEGRVSLDEGHWGTHAKLARVWEKLGINDKAMNGYRMAIASNHAKPGTYFRMALLHAKRRHLKQTVSSCVEGLLAAKDRALSRF